MNRKRLGITYPVKDITEVVRMQDIGDYDNRGVSELVSYLIPAYSPDEVDSILHTAFLVSKMLLMQEHKTVKFTPLCKFVPSQYFADSKRWKYDLVPMLTPADIYGKGYDIQGELNAN
jgi:hypothetical protein